MSAKRKDDNTGVPSGTGGQVRQGLPGRLFITCLFALAGSILLLWSQGMAAPISGYFGAGIGNASATFDQGHLGFDQEDLSPNQTAWRLFAGSQLNPYAGVEVGYVHLGKPKAHTEPAVNYFEVEMTGFDVTPVGTLPLGKGFSVFARAGLIFWESKISFARSETNPGSETINSSNLTLGLGAKYEVFQNLAVRAEFTRYAVSKFNAGLGDFTYIGLSGVLVLGRK